MYKDISLDFDKLNPITGDIGALEDEAAIKGAIKNLLFTRQETLPFNRFKGCKIEDALFEQNDIILKMRLESQIERLLDYFEPRVEFLGLEIDQNRNHLSINISYRILDTNQKDDLTLELGRTK